MRKRTHFLKIQRGDASQYTKKRIAGDTYKLKVTDRVILRHRK